MKHNENTVIWRCNAGCIRKHSIIRKLRDVIFMKHEQNATKGPRNKKELLEILFYFIFYFNSTVVNI